jgi:predicted RNase H-like HicB family nuclease
MRSVAFIHQDPDGFGVSFPDFPGCIAHGPTVEAALTEAEDALAFHVEGLREDGIPIPPARDADAIRADASLDDWREGATLAYVPLVFDLGTPRRVNVSFDPGLLAEIDAEALRRRMSRSHFLASAARAAMRGHAAPPVTGKDRDPVVNARKR